MEWLGPAKPVDVVIEQFAYLVAKVQSGHATSSEMERFRIVERILLEPMKTRKFMCLAKAA